MIQTGKELTHVFYFMVKFNELRYGKQSIRSNLYTKILYQRLNVNISSEKNNRNRYKMIYIIKNPAALHSWVYDIFNLTR